MKPGRALSLLLGIALLGAIAAFNEMTPEAQALLIGDARMTAQSWLASVVAVYNGMMAAPDAPAASRTAQGRDAALPPRTASHQAAAESPPPSGNPLWALPLRQLSATRDRPIFSPSRRPPPPPPTLVAPVAAVRQAPAPPPEPERPQVTLLGTIIGTKADDQIAVFLDAATQTVIRLRAGEDHQGWVLRLVKVREATLEKADQVVVLSIPAPGEAPVPPGGIGPLPGMLPGGMPPGGIPPGAAIGAQVNANPSIPQLMQQQQHRQRRQR